VLGRSAEDSDNFISSGGDSFSALALYNLLGSHFPVQAPLLESILSGTFLKVLQNLQENSTNGSENKKLHLISNNKRSVSSRNPTDDQANGENKKLKSSRSSVICKSKGRWTGYDQSLLLLSSVSVPDRKVRKLSLKPSWKVDFKKCLDSSPLLILQGETQTVVGCSHAGIVAVVDIMTVIQYGAKTCQTELKLLQCLMKVNHNINDLKVNAGY